jgi:chitin synthase
MPPMSQYAPQLPFMPYAGGPGSYAGSDHGGNAVQMPMAMPPMGFPPGGNPFGMMPNVPRNTMMSMGMFGSGASQSGSVLGVGPSFAAAQRPMSTFSMATTAGQFAGPSMDPNPSDDDLVNALRIYLSTQDLMAVTKKCVKTSFPL